MRVMISHVTCLNRSHYHFWTKDWLNIVLNRGLNIMLILCFVWNEWEIGRASCVEFTSSFFYISTAISRKVVGKNVHATTPTGNMGYDQYTVPNDCSCRSYFGCFPLALANICPWPLVPFFPISLENRADKTTHNTFRDCLGTFSDNLSQNSWIWRKTVIGMEEDSYAY